MFSLYTFGDSILDCGFYNRYRLTPAGLIVANDDKLFPEFRGRDLSTRGPSRVIHRAVDGATVDDLNEQLEDLDASDGSCAALLTIGGNDLLHDLFYGASMDLPAFSRKLDEFLKKLPIRPILIGNVYDPSCGDDAQNLLGLDPALARPALRRLNETLRDAADRLGSDGRLIDIHAHFLTGDPSWFVQVIEPSLTGASEIRRAFLPALLDL